MPRGGDWGERVAAAARERGLAPLVVPLIRAEPAADPAPLDRAARRLAAPAGRPDRPTDDGGVTGVTGVTGSAGYSWIVVTSATAVRVIAERVPSLPAGIRVAAVGRRTEAAARRAGWHVDVVPESASAADLVSVVPDTAGTVLFPRSDLAASTLVDGLRARGIDVDDVVAYRTVGTGDEPIRLDPVPDAVLVTSGSVARQVAARMAPLDARTRVACIGPRTADDARAAGLPVHVVGRSRSAEALLDDLVRHLGRTDPGRSDPAPIPGPDPDAPPRRTGRPS